MIIITVLILLGLWCNLLPAFYSGVFWSVYTLLL